MNTNKPYGFSIIELITVVAIMVILITLASTAAHNARVRANKVRAHTEAQQLVTAFKSYRAANRTWPANFDDGISTSLSKDNLAVLTGDVDANVYVYIEIPPDRFEGTFLVDPWGNAYQIAILPEKTVKVENTYKILATFQNKERYFYK